MTREEAINKVRQMSLPKETMEILQALAPELRESEDERIRKWLIEEIKATHDYDSPTSRKCVDAALAYLEKQKDLMPPTHVDPCDASWDAYYQRGLNKGYELGLEAGKKEQKPLSTEETELNSIAFLEQLGYTCVPPGAKQKPLMSDGEIEDKKRDIVAAIRKYYPADYAAYLTSFLKRLSPEDNSEDEYGQEILGIAYKLMYEHIPENLRTQEFWDSLKFMREYTGKVAIIHSYEHTAEWSEEDKEMLLSIINAFRNGTVSTIGQEQWLKSLPKRFNLKPEQEWSAYDKATIEYIIEDIKELRDEETDEEIIETYDRELNLLQCINDSVKLCNYTNPTEWSEEDEKMLKAFLHKVEVCDLLTNKENVWIVKKLKSLRPQVKAEWSEEDKDYYDTIVRKLEVIGDDSGLSDNQIKFLREHCPLNCSEWSKEDEKKIHFLSRLIELQVKDDEYCFGEDFRTISKQEAIEMLKSLRPQPKQEWSDKDKQKLNRIYDILGYAADDKGFLTSKRIIGDKEAIELQDFLKSLRPTPKE